MRASDYDYYQCPSCGDTIPNHPIPIKLHTCNERPKTNEKIIDAESEAKK